LSQLRRPFWWIRESPQAHPIGGSRLRNFEIFMVSLIGYWLKLWVRRGDFRLADADNRI